MPKTLRSVAEIEEVLKTQVQRAATVRLALDTRTTLTEPTRAVMYTAYMEAFTITHVLSWVLGDTDLAFTV